MTVGELIDVLRTFDPAIRAVVEDNFGHFDDPQTPFMLKVHDGYDCLGADCTQCALGQVPAVIICL